MSKAAQPQVIGVFGGTFNPIHLGHVLLAVTTQQTKPVDSVVLVPVFKHHVKTDLLPFEDRVAMCEHAVACFKNCESRGEGLVVSTIEREVGESNGKMLQALKRKYPEGSKFLWICGDDVFDWIEEPKGLETMREVSGLIVQRRLHKLGEATGDRFYKAPLDELKIRAVASRLNLDIDFINGELPHFSSTLVRHTPDTWQSFLPQSVAKYLGARPELLTKLLAKKEAEKQAAALAETSGRHQQVRQQQALPPPALQQGTLSTSAEEGSRALAGECESIMRGFEAVHLLQLERGLTGLRLTLGASVERRLQEARQKTDKLLREAVAAATVPPGCDACCHKGGAEHREDSQELLQELAAAASTVGEDRALIDQQLKHMEAAQAANRTDDNGFRRSVSLGGDGTKGQCGKTEGWPGGSPILSRLNHRIDVLMGACVRAVEESLVAAGGSGIGSPMGRQDKLSGEQQTGDLSQLLLLQWLEGQKPLTSAEELFATTVAPKAPAPNKASQAVRHQLHQVVLLLLLLSLLLFLLLLLLLLMLPLLLLVAILLASLHCKRACLAASRRLAAPDAAPQLLERVATWEWALVGCFAAGTLLPLVHQVLQTSTGGNDEHGSNNSELEKPSCKVEWFCQTMSATVDLMLDTIRSLAEPCYFKVDGYPARR